MRDLIKLSSIEALFQAEKSHFDQYRQHWADIYYLHHDGVLCKKRFTEIKKHVEWDSNCWPDVYMS